MFFQKGDLPKRIHVYVVVKNGSSWNDIIFFPDALRNSVSLRDEYSKMKKIVVGDKKIYRSLKNVFVERILKN